jgi:uncharacterized protein (UPF0276 family)
VGLAYRHVIHNDLMRHRDQVDLIEISNEDYIVRQRLLRGDADQSKLREAIAAIPSVAHGLSLSIGSVDAPNEAYLDATRRFLEEHRIAVFSEHLAYHQIDGTDLSVFMCMPFAEESIAWLKRAYYHARRALGRPFALENVTYYFPVPHCGLSEADFLRRLTEETDCSLLLDVTNVFNNAHNHRYDPIAFLDRLPLDRVSQIHLAGGHQTPDGRWEDSHSAQVMAPVWPLFEEVIRRTEAEIVILERDSKFHPFGLVLEDLGRAREIFRRHRPATPSGPLRTFAGPTDAPAPDHTAPEFHNLRAFQQALVARLTNPDFRAAFDRDPALSLAQTFGLNSPQWAQRLIDCDRFQVERLAESWESFQAENRLEELEYEQSEWAAWAAVLEKENAPTS